MKKFFEMAKRFQEIEADCSVNKTAIVTISELASSLFFNRATNVIEKQKKLKNISWFMHLESSIRLANLQFTISYKNKENLVVQGHEFFLKY